MTQEQDTPFAELYGAAYEELRKLAAAVKRGDGSATLNPTALVNEAYLKLSRSLALEPESERHFKRLAVRAMRQVLVEAARRRLARKRGGDQAMVTFDEASGLKTLGPERFLGLAKLLDELKDDHPRPQQVIEYRFFGGYSHEEIADLLDVSPSTVDRDWRFARAWLKKRLGPPPREMR